jgi:hypothetical protein
MAITYATRLAAPDFVRIASRPSIIASISLLLTLSAGMKRSVSGRGALSSTPSSKAAAANLAETVPS